MTTLAKITLLAMQKPDVIYLDEDEAMQLAIELEPSVNWPKPAFASQIYMAMKKGETQLRGIPVKILEIL